MTVLEHKILQELRNTPVIPFSKFMELALYCPDCGFYEKEPDTIGKTGHFYTSVSVGRVFGELLACRFAQWLGKGEAPSTIVEAGAHDGKLALDILSWLQQHRPALYDQLTYTVIESSPRRRHWQEQTLQAHCVKVQWIGDVAELSALSCHANVLFSNELLDAFPVHVLQWDAAEQSWAELGVGYDGTGFCWKRLPEISREVLPHLPDRSLASVLPDRYKLEISPAAIDWWQRAARTPGLIRLVTFDYGFSHEDRLAPERQSGTLRAYDRHHASVDVLRNPGEQDLTSHVDFPEIQAAGEQAGLVTEQFTTQGRYLSQIAAEAQSEWSWTPDRIRQFQTLTHPDHLGTSFKVLVQAPRGPGDHDGAG